MAYERTSQLTFICTLKRHHIRFFGDAKDDPLSVEGKNQNIPAGTVVDSAVVADARGAFLPLDPA